MVFCFSSISLRNQPLFHPSSHSPQSTAHVYKVMNNTNEVLVVFFSFFFNVPWETILTSIHTTLPWKHSFVYSHIQCHVFEAGSFLLVKEVVQMRSASALPSNQELSPGGRLPSLH